MHEGQQNRGACNVARFGYTCTPSPQLQADAALWTQYVASQRQHWPLLMACIADRQLLRVSVKLSHQQYRCKKCEACGYVTTWVMCTFQAWISDLPWQNSSSGPL